MVSELASSLGYEIAVEDLYFFSPSLESQQRVEITAFRSAFRGSTWSFNSNRRHNSLRSALNVTAFEVDDGTRRYIQTDCFCAPITTYTRNQMVEQLHSSSANEFFYCLKKFISTTGNHRALGATRASRLTSGSTVSCRGVQK